MPFCKELVKALNIGLRHIDLQLTPNQTKEDKQEEFNFVEYLHRSTTQSNSQLYQDMFVLYMLHNKNNGFFVEFGATDGISLSNTYILETRFNWRGILAEPARDWKARLLANRNCAIDNRCVWSKTAETLEFNEVSGEAELSTLHDYSHLNIQSATADTRYSVETVSLDDLLRQHNAPKIIDYLSIDTEGSEFDILRNFDFDSWDISIITIEHNFFPKSRRMINNLLTSKGYTRKFRSLSRWDDWYVKQSNFSNS